MPWQQHVADVVGEVEPDGSLAYDKAVIVVGRQEGKTEYKFVVAVHRSTAMARTHGPQLTTFTMQTRTKARARLEVYERRLQEPRVARSFREITNPRRKPAQLTEWQSSFNNGHERIQFGPASFIQIDAPSRTGSHGDTLDLGEIDEAFAHEHDRIETGMEPAMATRRDAQLLVLSAAGDSRSKYLWRQIRAGRAAWEAYEGGDRGAFGRTAYFEYSVPDDADPGDPRTWRLACPALGFTISERFLASKWEKALKGGQEAIDRFCRSYLSMWPETPILDEELGWRIVSEQVWRLMEDERARPQGRERWALDVDTNERGEEWASIGRSDGRLLEVATPEGAGEGTEWVVPTLEASRSKVGEVWLDPRGRAGNLVPSLRRAGIRVHLATQTEVVQASMLWAAAVKQGECRHRGHPALTTAVGGAIPRPVGDGQWRFSRTMSLVDIGPLWAVALARFAATQKRPTAAPRSARSESTPTVRTDDLAAMPF